MAKGIVKNEWFESLMQSDLIKQINEFREDPDHREVKVINTGPYQKMDNVNHNMNTIYFAVVEYVKVNPIRRLDVGHDHSSWMASRLYEYRITIWGEQKIGDMREELTDIIGRIDHITIHNNAVTYEGITSPFYFQQDSREMQDIVQTHFRFHHPLCEYKVLWKGENDTDFRPAMQEDDDDDEVILL